jgi:hypothetical protein
MQYWIGAEMHKLQAAKLIPAADLAEWSSITDWVLQLARPVRERVVCRRVALPPLRGDHRPTGLESGHAGGERVDGPVLLGQHMEFAADMGSSSSPGT